MGGPWEKYQTAPVAVAEPAPQPMIIGTPRAKPGQAVDLARDQVGLERDRLAVAAAQRDASRVPVQMERDRLALEKDRIELEKARKGGGDPKATEGMRQSAAFYSRADNALKGYGDGVAPRGALTQTVVDMLPNRMVNANTDPARQQADAYANEFVAATLRKESGAAIPPAELEAQKTRYFPQPGDAPATIEAKTKLRATALEAIRLQAGDELAPVTPAVPAQTGAATAQVSNEPPPLEVDVVGGRQPTADEIAKDPELRDAYALKASIDKNEGVAGAGELLKQGAMLGLGDEAAGIGNALYNAVSSPFTSAAFDPVAAYHVGNQAQDMRLDDARRTSGITGAGAEILGGFASGNPTNALAGLTTLGGRVAAGVKAGVTGGALAGFGYGEGAQNSLLSAAGGAAVGGVIGGAIPTVGGVVANRVGGLRRMLGRDPDLARNIVGDAIRADANTPRSVGTMLDDAGTRGSPLALADTGGNARGLLASVGRQPGNSATITREAVIPRQMEQAERIGSAVRRDLGPTANLRERGEELVAQARADSAPIYDAALSRSGASSVKLDDLTKRPAFQSAMKNAQELAAEEGIDPTSLGFQFNEAGDVVLDRVPSWQTLDYVKRGLDDVVEKSRDKTTGKLVLDEAGRATNNTRRMLVARMDAINPEYKAARAAYAGPVKMREAMDMGAKALNQSPDDLQAEMARFGPPELEMYRLGLRKSVVDMLDSRVDGGDKVGALIGTPKKRAALARAFGAGGEKFDRFIATLRDEAAMNETYRSVATGSQTAERGAFDATTSDTGLAEEAVGAALRGAKDGLWPSIVNGLQHLRTVDKYGAGKAGEATRERIAALMTETDPSVLRELLVAARRAAARQRISGRQSGRRAIVNGRQAGVLSGALIGGTTKQPAN